MISKNTEKRIFEIFIHAITNCHNDKHVTALIADVLTPTERIMIAKRLCIAYLLLKGKSYDYIANVLKVSRTTIGFVAFNLKEKGDGYRYTLSKLISSEKLHQFIEQLDTIFDNILYPAPGAGHRYLKKMERIKKHLEKPSF